MTVKSAPFYWVECDEPGCGAKSGDDSDFAAWAEVSTALDEASSADWSRVGDSNYCEPHWREQCEEDGCLTLIDRKQAIEHDDLCDEHWAVSEAGLIEEANRG